MKITKQQSTKQNWDKVRSWNYKITDTIVKQSVVYAELDGDHGEVQTLDSERIYYILSGKGEFEYGSKVVKVEKDDVVTIPPNTTYNYHPLGNETLKVLLFMELWNN